MDTKKKIAVLVLSCDKYSDLWPTFFNLFERFWPNCPYDVYLQTNYLVYQGGKNVKSLTIGIDKTWSDGLKKSLMNLTKYEYVLILLEDMFLSANIDDNTLELIIDQFIIMDGNFITLINEPKPDRPVNKHFGIISKNAMYRSTTTASLWKQSVLLDLLDDTENAWQFEKVGSKRSDKYEGFYSVNQDVFKFIHGVIKGKWTRKAKRDLQKLNVNLNSKRETFSLLEEIKFWSYKRIRKIILMLVPFGLRRKLLKNN
ncbi:MAG: hypothetical protein KKG99_00085 [Bacteroidetes bacterium]|nr:hypothetical protein [Bacteroidota bacterium]